MRTVLCKFLFFLSIVNFRIAHSTDFFQLFSTQRSSEVLCDTASTDFHKSFWTFTNISEYSFQIIVQAIDECNNFRKSGGDVFVAHAYSSTAIIAGELQENQDGKYLFTFYLPQDNTSINYHVKVMLGIRVTNKLVECYSNHQNDCRSQFHLKFSQLKNVTQCIWEYVMPYDSQAVVEVYSEKKVLTCTKNATSVFSMRGMWRKIDTCRECIYCKSMMKVMSRYDWKHSYIYDTIDFQQKWYFKNSDVQKCKYGKSIAFAGDSVTKKGFLISARKFHISINVIDLYSIFDVDGKNLKKHKTQVQLRAMMSGRTRFSTVVFGTGRHDLTENSIEEYMIQLELRILPLLKKLNGFGTKIVWILTSAPRHREPASSRQRLYEKVRQVTVNNKKLINSSTVYINNLSNSCIHLASFSRKKEQCFHGVDSCERYPQRWDRVLELNYQLRLFFKSYEWINVFDSFQITNSGMWEWYDDNVHHHNGASGIGDMVFQYILNMICNLDTTS